MNEERLPNKRSEVVWAVYNWGNLVAVHHLRKYALEYAIENCPSDCQWKDVYEIRRVRVLPLTRG
jgi:hypothetical protein